MKKLKIMLTFEIKICQMQLDKEEKNINNYYGERKNIVESFN